MNTHNISFPQCSKNCPIIEIFGCCECESTCPHKFKEDGAPINLEEMKWRLEEQQKK